MYRKSIFLVFLRRLSWCFYQVTRLFFAWYKIYLDINVTLMLIRVFNFGFECSAWFCFYRYLRHRLHMYVNFHEVLRLYFYFRRYKGKSPRGRHRGPKKTIFWPFFEPNDHNTYHKMIFFLSSQLQVHRHQMNIILDWYVLPILKNQPLKIRILADFS